MKELLIRVPEVTFTFWIIKVLSTTVGETGADYLSFNLELGMLAVSLIMVSIMTILLILQFKLFKSYVPPNYWSIVVLMSITGTLITDILVDYVGISLETLSLVFTISMIIGFIIWFKEEKTLSIHSINTAKREIYYWVIILLTFALGTGVGDLISEGFALGYTNSLLLFSSCIAAIAFAHYILKLNSVTSFWLAFILTRPLGASLGDYLTKPISEGGLGFGMTAVNLNFFIIIVGLVIYLTFKQKKSDTPKLSLEAN